MVVYVDDIASILSILYPTDKGGAGLL